MGVIDPAGIVASLVHGQVNMARFNQLVLEKFGGVDGLVNMLYANYAALDDGNKTKVHILENLLALLERESAREVPGTDLTESEIRQELRRHLDELLESEDGITAVGGLVGDFAEDERKDPPWEEDRDTGPAVPC